MIPDRVLRFIWTLFLSTLGIFVLCQPAMAARTPPRHVAVLGLSASQASSCSKLRPALPALAVWPIHLPGWIGLSPSQTCYDPYQMRHAYRDSTC